MPELPEVQTIVTELKSTVEGKIVKGIESFREGTIDTIGDELSVDEIITDVSRRGKYIIIKTVKNIIVVHLRMTGKLIVDNSIPENLKHIRAVIYLSENKNIIFDDVRTFGTIKIYPANTLVSSLDNLGVEPLSEDFNSDYLITKMKKHKSPIKNILLNQMVIAGIGNIYACEILFRSGVNPETKPHELCNKSVEKIVFETKEVLKEAIKCNGTTISDYRRVDDKQGSFQNFLQVYGKSNCPSGHKILKIKQAGRSTYYCPVCQSQENK